MYVFCSTQTYNTTRMINIPSKLSSQWYTIPTTSNDVTHGPTRKGEFVIKIHPCWYLHSLQRFPDGLKAYQSYQAEGALRKYACSRTVFSSTFTEGRWFMLSSSDWWLTSVGGSRANEISSDFLWLGSERGFPFGEGFFQGGKLLTWNNFSVARGYEMHFAPV